MKKLVTNASCYSCSFSRAPFGAIEALLSCDANPNAVNNTGWTPLHIAASNGLLEQTALLITSGADVNAECMPHLRECFVLSVFDVVSLYCNLPVVYTSHARLPVYKLS